MEVPISNRLKRGARVEFTVTADPKTSIARSARHSYLVRRGTVARATVATTQWGLIGVFASAQVDESRVKNEHRSRPRMWTSMAGKSRRPACQTRSKATGHRKKFIDSPACSIKLRRLTQVDLVVNSRGKDGVVVHAITDRRFAIS